MITRRDLIAQSSAVAALSAVPVLSSCGGTSAPDGLPEYTYDGPAGPESLFQHGVASGDPGQDSILLWTRVTPEAAAASVPVFYEVATDVLFSHRVAAGTTETTPERDYTVKVVVEGLTQGRDYYYRFRALGRSSRLGHTRVTGAPELSHLRFGVCSCASYAHGWFHGYRHLAARTDLDAVLHLGDYIYEYGTGEYGDAREYEPSHEIVTLQDYRARYAQYRRDPDLQAAHAQHAFISVWDDHETADNSYRDGANNHEPANEGSWPERVAAARKAYFEWMPVRETPELGLYRRVQYGQLADLIFLDTRIAGRDPQSSEEDTIAMGSRQLLGIAQEDWLERQLSESAAHWKLLAQQVVFAPWSIFNEDAWDGYPEARKRVLEMIRTTPGGNAVVLTGDIHTSWAYEVPGDPADLSSEPICAEFVCPGISSPGFPINSAEAAQSAHNGMRESNPHLRFVNLWQRGYIVLDLTRERLQADWFLLDGVEQDAGQESFIHGSILNSGSSRLTEASSPAG